MKRSHLKRFSAKSLNTGNRLNPVVMSEYRKRAVSGSNLTIEQFLNLLIPNKSKIEQLKNIRLKCLERIRELTEDDVRRNVVLLNGRYQRTIVFYNAKQTEWRFVHTNTFAGYNESPFTTPPER